MLDQFRHRVLAPVLSRWLLSSAASWRRLETPSGAAISRAAGPDPDQIALIGCGIAVGYGVHSNDLALGGQLARQLSAITGRGATVDTFAEIAMQAPAALAVARSIDVGRFDAVILTLGSDDALRLTRADEFRHHIDLLLDWFARETPGSLAVVAIAIPDLPTIVRIPPPFVRVVRGHCRRLNAELRAACAQHGVRFLPFFPVASDLMGSERGIYAAWAALLAPSIAEVVDTQFGKTRLPTGIDEHARQHALDELGILDTDPDDRFDRLVSTARDLFGVAGASITFVDRDRQWTKACAGMDRADSPRGGALGAATVDAGTIFVVPDAQVDDRFAGHQWVVGVSKVRFFAGSPIAAANGQRIGALCLVDATTREFTASDAMLLGDLTQQVEALLWGDG